MAEVFISYAREDQSRISELIRLLEQARFSVFWDRTIPPGRTWRSYIGTALDSAKCVIVVWSRNSVDSPWVQEEADDARQRGILVPVLLDSISPPLGFRSIQAADLTAEGENRQFHLNLVLEATQALCGARAPAPRSAASVDAAANGREAIAPHASADLPRADTLPAAETVSPVPASAAVAMPDAAPIEPPRGAATRDEQPAKQPSPALWGAKGCWADADELVRAYTADSPRTFFMRSEIPEQKARNARASTGMPRQEQIIALMDLTTFGSAKNCIVFGACSLYASYDRDVMSVPYSKFANLRIELVEDPNALSNSELRVGDRVVHGVLMNPWPSRVAALLEAIQQAVSGQSEPDALRALLRRHLTTGNLYIHPWIPREKLANARKSAGLPSGEQPVALLDLTFFGSATDNIVFTATTLYNRTDASRVVIAYRDLAGVDFSVPEDSHGLKILAGKKMLDLGASAIGKRLVELLNAIKALQHTAGTASN
jgi:hypothetical protein